MASRKQKQARTAARAQAPAARVFNAEAAPAAPSAPLREQALELYGKAHAEGGAIPEGSPDNVATLVRAIITRMERQPGLSPSAALGAEMAENKA